MVKKLQTSLVVFLCAFSILYGSEEEPKRRIFFTTSSASKYPEGDFRNWARPKTRANIRLNPGESIPSGYVLSSGTPSGYTRYVTKKLPIATKEELYNQFISGYGPSDEETQKNLRMMRPPFGAHNSDEEARKELKWQLEENWETGRLSKLRDAEEAFLKKVEQQTPQSYVKPRKNQPLFSSYESPAISSSSTPKTGYLTRFLTWLGWYKPTYVAPQASVSESLKPLQQVSE
jgi:hypothetical protein